MTDKQRRRVRLFKWRLKSAKWRIWDLNARGLAKSLDGENLAYEDIPDAHYRAVVEFRHLRQDARIRACEAFLET
jgi:hypothetical protein